MAKAVPLDCLLWPSRRSHGTFTLRQMLTGNPATQQSVTVRILDQCSNGGLDLETDAFNAIDSNKAGYNAGHLYTTYTFVNC
eukprot:Gb_35483 [translate_table: standard]